MNKPTLYILCGIPFSGKSTLSNAILKANDCVRIDLDEVKFQTFGNNIKDEEINQQGWDNIYQEMYKQIKETLLEGKTVLHDTGNFTKYERGLVRKIADELDIPSKTIYVNVPEQVARERWLKNQKTKERFDISQEAFESAVKEMEPPANDEHILEYTPAINVDSWIHTHIWDNAAHIIKGVVHYEEYINPRDWKDFYGPELRSYAVRNFKGFIAILYFLLKEQKLQFELVVGGGDSGNAMVKLTELIYKKLNISFPKSIVIPVKRYKKDDLYWSEKPEDWHDNSSLLPQVKEKLNGITAIKNILYVDDEISYLGLTVKTCTNLVMKAVPLQPDTVLTVIGENHGLEWKQKDPSIKVNLYQFSEGVDDLYSAILYVIPTEIEKELKDVFTDKELDVKARMNILLGLPFKKITNGKQEFSYKRNALVKQKIPHIAELQQQFAEYIAGLIPEAVNEYIKGKVQIFS